jgi:hypothetical protein
MEREMMPDRILHPLFQKQTAVVPTKASRLELVRCDIETARALIKVWHSRLPQTQTGPWQFAFAAHHCDVIYGVALWHNPSARTLPHHWLELRRLAIAPDAPHCAASWMLGAMVKWFEKNHPEREKAISYQDEGVHKGTIYAAAGWKKAFRTAARVRDRSGNRPSGRKYRTSINGADADVSAKVRWEKMILGKGKAL